jgi:hypothetical protein
MKLVGRIPVEPLSDERMTNIERRVVSGAAERARPSRGFPRWGFVAAYGVIAMIVVCAGVAGYQLRGGRSATVAESVPVEVRTDRERTVLDIGDATITSDPATVFVVTRPDGGVLVTMTRGKVELDVAKRAGRAPLVVRAGDTDVVVVGTRLSVDYGDGTHGVDVRVTEGVVKVARRQLEVHVAAGEAWTTERGVVAIAELGTTVALGDRTGATIGDIATTDDRIEIDTGQSPDVLHERTAAVPDARIPNVAAGSNESRQTKPANPERTRPRTLDDPSDPLLDLKTAIRRQTVMRPLDVGIRDPKAAVDEYRRMVVDKENVGKSLAWQAFYSIAAVQSETLGEYDAALATLEGYQRRFSGGEEHAAALWLRVRILCLRKVDDRCRQAAHTYMQGAPGTPAAAIAERITLTR